MPGNACSRSAVSPRNGLKCVIGVRSTWHPVLAKQDDGHLGIFQSGDAASCPLSAKNTTNLAHRVIREKEQIHLSVDYAMDTRVKVLLIAKNVSSLAIYGNSFEIPER
jgi:hypothetical protein